MQLQAKQAAATIQSNTHTLLTKVNAYVPLDADAQCIVGVGAVRVLDAAAQGIQLPSAPVSVPDAPSGVALSDIVSDSVANAAAFQTAAARLKAWDHWCDAQETLADGE